MNGDKDEVIACVKAATPDLEVKKDEIVFSCKPNSLSYLKAMLSIFVIQISESGK